MLQQVCVVIFCFRTSLMYPFPLLWLSFHFIFDLDSVSGSAAGLGVHCITLRLQLAPFHTGHSTDVLLHENQSINRSTRHGKYKK